MTESTSSDLNSVTSSTSQPTIESNPELVPTLTLTPKPDSASATNLTTLTPEPTSEPAPETTPTSTVESTPDLTATPPSQPFPSKKFLQNHRTIVFLALPLVLVVLLSLVFGKISPSPQVQFLWDPRSDASLDLTTATNLRLAVKLKGKNAPDADQIKFTSDSGKLEYKDNIANWQLPETPGIYKITASLSTGQSIEKTIRLVRLQDENQALAKTVHQNQELSDPNSDSDADGLSDAEEKNLGTDPITGDTDQDGLGDLHEVRNAKTDPKNPDTDGDGLTDGNELVFSLDPLKPDSRSDGQKDGQRNFIHSFSSEDDQVSLQLSGTGNLASATIDIINHPQIKSQPHFLGQIYNFHTNGNLASATVSIKYQNQELQAKNLDAKDLTLFHLDDQTKKLTPVDTTVNLVTSTLTAKLDHFSRYLVGSKKAPTTPAPAKIMFVIDNSISMYSEFDLYARLNEEYMGAIGNDVDFNRLRLTQSMVETLGNNYQFGVAEFAGSYSKHQAFTKDRNSIKQSLDNMRYKWRVSTDGTNIRNALQKGISEFSIMDSSAQKSYLILLTDGKDTTKTFKKHQSQIIQDAKKLNLSICILGVGLELDSQILSEIASATGCGFYPVSHSSSLDEIYNLLGSSLNYNYIDTNKDQKVDGMINADSGFIVSRDGFSFENFSSQKSEGGHCYGMALFAMLRFTNNLPTSMPQRTVSKLYLADLFKEFGKTEMSSMGYDLSNTYFTTSESLHSFRFTSPGLKALFHSTQPSDLRDRIENGVWKIKQKYRESLENLGAEIREIDVKGYDGFTKAEVIRIPVEGPRLAAGSTKDESSLLQAIWRLFLIQTDHKTLSFSTEPDKAFPVLVERLKNGVPVLIGINGNHGINATRLIQDNQDPNHFKLEVYDNNYPSQPRYIDVKRGVYSKFKLDYTAMTNKNSYTFLYDSNNDGTLEKTSLSIATPSIK